jgi:hypothetical protein
MRAVLSLATDGPPIKGHRHIRERRRRPIRTKVNVLRQIQSHIAMEIFDHPTRQVLPQAIVHFDPDCGPSSRRAAAWASRNKSSEVRQGGALQFAEITRLVLSTM